MVNKEKSSLSQDDILNEALPRYRSLLSDQDYAKLLVTIERPLNQAIRLNPLKTDPERDIHHLAQKYGWQIEAIPFCSTGWWIKEARIEPSKTIEHRMGHYYIQDAASMLPVELFDFKNDRQPLVLDMAASPGGKTTHIISRTCDHGLVIANDSSRSRLTALRLVLQNWGAINKAITCMPGERFGELFPDTFDYVLLDAPCSMENLRSLDSHPMRSITEKERQNLTTRQKRLLESALKTVRVGGQVVYATCTLAPEEDEAVLHDLLNQYPDKIRIDSGENILDMHAPGLVSDGDNIYKPEVSNAIRLWPHTRDTSGFFAALITKTGEIESEGRGEKNFYDRGTAGFVNLPPIKIDSLSEDLLCRYGIDIFKITSDQHSELLARDKEVFITPSLLMNRLSSLPFSSAGLKLGEYHPRGFLISHEFASRFYRDCTKPSYTLPQNLHDAWLRGEDLRGKTPHNYPIGSVVIVSNDDNMFLGLGRVLADRLKNLLPKRIVL